MRFVQAFAGLAAGFPSLAYGASQLAIYEARPLPHPGPTTAEGGLSDYVSDSLRDAFAPCCGEALIAISPLLTLIQITLVGCTLYGLTIWCQYDQPMVARLTKRIRSIIARRPLDL